VQETELNQPDPSRLRAVLIGRRPGWTLVRICVFVAACVVLFKFVLLPIHIEGISMLPTFQDGRINVVNRLAYRWHEPRRGDVVSVRLAGPSVMFMKRIIGLPGETVSFHDGHTFIDGKLLPEPYLKLPCDWSRAPKLCGPTQYYVVGDNRSMPFELHTQGRVERDHIVGKVLL
jgi:signal peptidase I